MSRCAASRPAGTTVCSPRNAKRARPSSWTSSLGLDTRPAAADDDLTKTVHYGIVAEEVVAVVEGEPVNLIETLAERIAQTCLKHDGVQEVEVCVHKPDAPITVPFDDVTVTIIRSRA